MLLENHQQLCHTFFESYVYQDNMLLKKDLHKHFLEFIPIRNRIKYKITSMNFFITHFYSQKAFRNKFYCRRMATDCFITFFFEPYSVHEQCIRAINFFITDFLIFVAVRNKI